MERINMFKAACTALMGALTALWGWMGWLVVIWVGLMLLDWATGSGAAIKDGRWSSKVAREGIWHKAGMVVVVVVAAVADLLISLVLGRLPVVELPITYTGLICPLVLVWYCLTELGSIAENAVAMGAPCPEWLPKMLAVGKDAVNATGEHIEAAVEETDRKE
jgi:toxin secretion/phage lysis holin